MGITAAEARPVPIVADGAIALQGLGEGRLIPVVVLDTTDRPDIDELLRVHKHFGQGDVISQWIQLATRAHALSLVLRFKRPFQLNIVVDFDIAERNGLVDQILNAQAVYLQGGRPGNRLGDTLDNPPILVEVPIWA